MITLEGRLEKITFQNSENHYTIAVLKTENPENRVTVTGYLAGTSPGETLNVSGNWEVHPKYGQQFKVENYEVTLPATVDGIKSYLCSGIIKGIGRSLAKKLVSHFGENTLDVIENSPETLKTVSGIGKSKAGAITEAWKNHHAVRVLMQFLQERGVQASHGAHILKAFGTEAVSIIQKDPYRIAAEIPEAGFPVADTIALSMGFPADDENRVKACIGYILQSAASDGHIYEMESSIVQRCREMINADGDSSKHAIESLFESREVMIESPDSDSAERRIYPKTLYDAEVGIARKLKAMMTVSPDAATMDSGQIIDEIMSRLAIKLSDEQLEILQEILGSKTAIITGGPGTGKTTLIRSVSTLFERLGKQILLAAPTGRASRRLAEVTHRKAATVHKLLGYNLANGCFEKNQDDQLDADVVIIDEASMIDTHLMYHLLQAVPMSAVFILVGDVYQLPSVGPGNVLSDMIKSGAVKSFELKKIFRQDRESSIVINAHRVHNGERPTSHIPETPEDLSDFYVIKQSNPETVVATIVELCKKRIPERFNFDSMRDIQVITPMHKGDVGTINLNQQLQRALNTSPLKATYRGGTFRNGDKVMHLKNNYQKEVFNGDIGTIISIDNAKQEIVVNFDEREVVYEFDELDELSLAYAISVHKSQGSEYPAVIIPMMTQHYPLLQRNLLYTAMTRGKKLVIIVGMPQAVAISVNNDKPRRRFSSLDEKLKDNGSPGQVCQKV